MNCSLTATSDPSVFDTLSSCSDLSDPAQMTFLNKKATLGAITTISSNGQGNGYDGYLFGDDSFGIYYQGSLPYSSKPETSRVE